MGIIVINPTRRHKTDDLIQASIGMEDARGNPFQIVTLDWNQKRPNAHNAKTRGFEDALITRLERGLKIEYRLPGCAVWLLNDLTMTFHAKIPYTKHNMAILGSHFGDGLWTVRERMFRDQAKIIYDGIRDAMTPEQRAEDDKRVKGMHTSMFDKPEDAPDLRDFSGGGEQDKTQVLAERSELIKLQAKLDAQLDQIKSEREWIEGKVADLQRRGIMLSTHSEESLGKMHIAEIRTLAKKSGIKWKSSDKKDELIAKILKATYSGGTGSPLEFRQEPDPSGIGESQPDPLGVPETVTS